MIVSGDHGFVHIVNTLRPRGKKMVVIGVSWTTAVQLTDQADVVLYYDIDVDPPRGESLEALRPVGDTINVKPAVMQAATDVAGALRLQASGDDCNERRIGETLNLCLEIIEEFRSSDRDVTTSILGQELQKRMSGADFQRLARGRARDFAEALARKNLIRLVPSNYQDWLFLSTEPEERLAPALPAAIEPPRYDYGGFVYEDLREDARITLLSAISDELSKPQVDFLTFNRVREVVERVTGRDEYSCKNLVNNMVAVGILKVDGPRIGRVPTTGAPYQFNTLALDSQHPDVRRALHME